MDKKLHCLQPKWYCKFMFWLEHRRFIKTERGPVKYIITALDKKGKTIPMSKLTKRRIAKDEFITVTLPKGMKLEKRK